MRRALTQNHGARGGATVIVQRGQLVDTRRWFPTEHLVCVASAEKCFVGKPVELPHAAFGLGAKRNSGCVSGIVLRQRDLIRGQSDFRSVSAARETVILGRGEE